MRGYLKIIAYRDLLNLDTNYQIKVWSSKALKILKNFFRSLMISRLRDLFFSTQNFPKNENFLSLNAHTYSYVVSGGGNFSALRQVVVDLDLTFIWFGF